MWSSLVHGRVCSLFFFFNDTATTEIYTLSLHDALPIYVGFQIQQKKKKLKIKMSLMYFEELVKSNNATCKRTVNSVVNGVCTRPSNFI